MSVHFLQIEVGSDLYKIDTNATGAASTPAADSTPAPVEEAASTSSTPGTRQEVPVPIMGESITQGVLAAWTKGVGDYVAADEVVASIETDKVTVDVNSPYAGKIVEILAQEGDEIEVGGPLFVVMEGASGGPSTSAPTPAAKETVSTPAPTTTSTPAPAKKAAAPTPASSTPAPAAEKGNRSETRVKMTRMRQRIAQRLKESQSVAAMLTTFQEVSADSIFYNAIKCSFF